MSKRVRITILKFAAIGDVTMACRAIIQLATKYGNLIEIDWIIDTHLVALTKALLAHHGILQSLTIRWHTFNANNLFRGNGIQRAHETFQILRAVKRAQPNAIAILHRDWRYRALIRAIFRGKMVSVNRSEKHEVSAYISTIERAIEFNVEARSPAKSPSSEISPKNSTIIPTSIGILIGGAQNQKGAFLEKKWPHFEALIDLILKQTNETIHLFGGVEDIGVGKKITGRFEQEHARIINHIGHSKLEEIPALLAPLRVFISIDSGLAHIASTVMNQDGQKIITIFGPTNSAIWKPLPSGNGLTILLTQKLDCAPCYKNDGNFQTCKFSGRDFQKCMTNITATEVFEKIKT